MADASASWKTEINRPNASKEYAAVLLGYNQTDDESDAFGSQSHPFIRPNEYMKKMVKAKGDLKQSSDSEISTRTEVLSVDSSSDSMLMDPLQKFRPTRRRKTKRPYPKHPNSQYINTVPIYLNGDQHVNNSEMADQETKQSKTLMRRLLGRIRRVFSRSKRDEWGTNNSASRPTKARSGKASSRGNQRSRRAQGKSRPKSSSGAKRSKGKSRSTSSSRTRGGRAQGKSRSTSSSRTQRERRGKGKSRPTSSGGAQKAKRAKGKSRPTSSSGSQRGRREKGKSRSTSSSGAQRGRREKGKSRSTSSSGAQRSRRAQGKSRSTSSNKAQRGKRPQAKSRPKSSKGDQRGRRPQGKSRPRSSRGDQRERRTQGKSRSTSSGEAPRARRSEGKSRPTSSSGPQRERRERGKSQAASSSGEEPSRSTRTKKGDESPSLHCLEKTGTDATSAESDAEKAALEGRLCNVPFAAVPLNCHKKSTNPCGVPYAFLPLPGHQGKEETDARGNKRVPCGVPYAVIPMSGKSGDKEACGSPFGVFPLTDQVRYPLHEPKPYPSFVMSTGHHGPHDPHGPKGQDRTRRMQGHRCLRPRDICHTDSESSESTSDDSCMAEFLQDIEKKLVSKLNLQEVFMKELDNQNKNLLAERPCGSCPPQQPNSVCPVNFYSPIHRHSHIHPHHQRTCDEPGVEDRIDVMAKQLEILAQDCQESRATIEAQRKRQNAETALEDELAKGIFGRDIEVARRMNFNVS